jgi:hypothetical protein
MELPQQHLKHYGVTMVQILYHFKINLVVLLNLVNKLH